MSLPSMKVGPIESKFPIIQGGMGIGYSNYMLTGHVAKAGGIGVLSSACPDRIVGKRHGKKMKHREAIAQDVRDAKIIGEGGLIGMNIMVALVRSYEDSVLGSMDGGVDIIISGAGLPMMLPYIANEHPRAKEVALVPIASSGRAFELICKKWQRSGRLPDAVVVEGPEAGGHLAWRTVPEAKDEANHLDKITKDILEVAKRYGDIPVIAAGGIYSHEDIKHFMEMGCAGVQMGTRFVATHESGASDSFKNNVVAAGEDDIELATKPGSPSGLLFRVIKQAPFYQEALDFARPPLCNKGYLLNKKGECRAKDTNETSFCICNGLLAASDHEEKEKELYTVGSIAANVKKLYHVCDLMDELVTGVVYEGTGEPRFNPYADTVKMFGTTHTAQINSDFYTKLRAEVKTELDANLE